MTIATMPTIRRIVGPTSQALSLAGKLTSSPAASLRFRLGGGGARVVALGAPGGGAIAKESAGGDVPGVDRDRSAEVGDCPVEVALVAPDEAATVQRLGVLRIEPD